MIPLGMRIIVQRDDKEEIVGGIIRPNAEDSMKGTVLQVGAGRVTEYGKHIPCSVDVGDRILFVGKGIKVDDNIFIIRDGDVIAILEEED